MLHKVTQFHLDVTGQGRQRTKLAAQIFSNSFSKCMRHLFPEKIIQSDVLSTVNDWFDCMNSRRKFDKIQNSCALGIHEGIQMDSMRKMQTLVKNWIFLNTNRIIPFEKGIMASIQSTMSLYDELKLEGMEYLMTSRLNQDCLVIFF